VEGDLFPGKIKKAPHLGAALQVRDGSLVQRELAADRLTEGLCGRSKRVE